MLRLLRRQPGWLFKMFSMICRSSTSNAVGLIRKVSVQESDQVSYQGLAGKEVSVQCQLKAKQPFALSVIERSTATWLGRLIVSELPDAFDEPLAIQ
jgi:hypothetical protein